MTTLPTYQAGLEPSYQPSVTNQGSAQVADEAFLSGYYIEADIVVCS
jgi:hypothetical protein